MARIAALFLVALLIAGAAFTPDARSAPRSEYPILVAAIASTTVAISQAFGGLEASLRVPSLILPPEKMSCRGRIGSRTITGTPVFRPGRVTCKWKIPPGSRGKILFGTITVTIKGKTVVKHFRQRIK
jgi:hypothetical protein